MARSAHAYVRGSVAKFYDRVDASPGARRVTAWPAISIVGEAVKAGRYLAFVVGKAHARQMDDAVPQGWLAMLETIGAGRWPRPTARLWDSVVSLAGPREAGISQGTITVAAA